MNISTEERFWRHVDKTSDCWVWTGYTHHRDGYGHFKLNKKPVRAHRMSWEFENGSIPKGMGVLHICDNPPCVRPDHLFLGDQRVNLQDCARKNRLGFRAYKFTEDKVRSIRKDPRIQIEIAKDYNIAQHTVSMIKLRRIWKHIT